MTESMLSDAVETDPPQSSIKGSPGIQAIDKDAVHRICSGQVVLNLATAVKELVENSLDAGATCIEIRLKEYGSELVEVIDNGSGVEETNFQGLTLKHHTSKLREFSDLLDVETYGFRGEALSSLCALSEMTVITRHSSSNLGTKLTFDSRGLIISKTPCARQVGTTVSLLNLFSPLPVRQKEFIRNLKREFHKMTQLLYAYCLISRGVKILCSNQSKKGMKTVIASTQGSSTYKGNITCIFGAKQASSLLDLEQKRPEAQYLEEVGLSAESIEGSFVLEGCISSCAHGQGRGAPDRQFYYINDRPCEPSKVSKVVNEVYHQFNVNQYPFVFMNIRTNRSGVDVNVTPDKRQIFLEYEKLLLATVKATVLSLFENIPNTYQFNNVSMPPAKAPLNTSQPNLSDGPQSPSLGKFSSLLKTFRHSPSVTVEDNKEIYNSELRNTKTGRGVKRSLECSKYDKDGKKQLSLSAFMSSNEKCRPNEELEENNHQNQAAVTSELSSVVPQQSSMDVEMDPAIMEKNTHGSLRGSSSKSELRDETSNAPGEDFETSRFAAADAGETILHCHVQETTYDRYTNIHSSQNKSVAETMNKQEAHNTNKPQEIPPGSGSSETPKDTWNSNGKNEELTIADITVDENDAEIKSSSRKVVSINISLDTIKKKCSEMLHQQNDEKFEHWRGNGPRIRFYSEIDPSNNKSAEAELQKEISKDMFKKMEIVGQFNLGFIVTKLGPDLFIVDQHATDEKYNFEVLQMQTTLQNQKLIFPQSLDLTAANESILMENVDIFLKNGFSFCIDRTAEPSKRVRLTAKPVSHNWEFGKEDIDELLFMLQDSPQTMCRPSRVRSMFASRACRKSVMIGTALSKPVMRQLINHMGEIEQPWNCPHGRPTMRHLINLELIKRGK